MKKRIFILLTLTIILSIATVSAAENDTDVTAQIECAEIPFIENHGQTSEEVEYYANTFYGTVYVTNNSITHNIKGANNTTLVIKEQFLDKNGQIIYFQPQGLEKSNAKVDYYIGNDPSKWQTAMETWKTISLGELYPGIEVILRATGANVEKIFNIMPGSNPLDIQIQVLGTDQLEITSNGDLNMQTPVGGVQLSKPIAFQEETNVNANYQLTNNIYSFQVPEYDHNKTLTIDPTLQYSTCIGGSRGENAWGIAVDDDGNIYITGNTDHSPDFPTTFGAFQTNNHGDFDAFVTKLTPNNQGTADLLYSTYLGGAVDGDGYDDPANDGWDIAVDDDGNIYLTGTTTCNDFPISLGAYFNSYRGHGDAFVTKLAPNNQGTADLIYSSYIGASGIDNGYGIAVDDDGNIYITGFTQSTDFPTTFGAIQTSLIGGQSAFVIKLAPNNQGLADLLYSTYIGDNTGWNIAVDDDGNAYITGLAGVNHPTTPNAFKTSKQPDGIPDAFVTKLAPNNQGLADLLYSTYMGGGSYDEGWDIAVDDDGNIYITGNTLSTDFPTTYGAFQPNNLGGYDAFVSKLAPNGQGAADLLYSTYIGGTWWDRGWGIAVDDDGDIYITGHTGSVNYPTTANAYQTSNQGGFDAFISKLAPNNQGLADLIYSTYIGAGSHDHGHDIAVDEDENIYITGNTASTYYPTTIGSFQLTNNGYDDAFITKLGYTETNLVALDTTGAIGGNAVLSATLTDADGIPLVSQLIDFFVDGTFVGSDDTNANGVAVLIHPITETVGLHTILARFMGDDEYLGSEDTAILTVKIATIILAADSTGALGDNALLSATLTDANGNSLVSKLVDFFVDGTFVGSDDTNVNGLAVLIHPITETVGQHTILARFNEENDFFGSEDTAILTVNKIVTNILATDSTGTIGGSAVLSATLTDANGNSLMNKIVEFLVDGTLVGSISTNFNGLAILIHPITETAGLHTILARFNEDNDFLASQDTAVLTVNKIVTNILASDSTGTIGGNALLSATLTDVNGFALVSKLVDFFVDGTFVGSDDTNTNGVAVLIHPITETAGMHTILARFNEDQEYLGSQDTDTLTATESNLYVTITSSKINPTVGDTITITFKVGNHGPSTAEDVVMSLTIPKGMEFIIAAPDQGKYSYEPSTRTLTWDLGDVVVGDPYLYLTVNVIKAGKYVIHPTLSTSTYDPNLQENIGTLVINAQSKNVRVNAYGITVGQQKTGSSITALVLAALLVIAGLIVPRKK